MRSMVFAGGPNFMEKKEAELIEGVMQVVLQTAFLLTRGTNDRADFSLQQQVLAIFRTKQDDERHRFLGEFRDF